MRGRVMHATGQQRSCAYIVSEVTAKMFPEPESSSLWLRAWHAEDKKSRTLYFFLVVLRLYLHNEGRYSKTM